MSAAGRNDPCPCGSGKKYKKCCLREEEARTPAVVEPPKPAPAERAGRWVDSWRLPYSTDEGLAKDPEEPFSRLERWARSVDPLVAAGRFEEAYRRMREGIAQIGDLEAERNALDDLEKLCASHEELRAHRPDVCARMEEVCLALDRREEAGAAVADRAEALWELGRRDEAVGEMDRVEREYPESSWGLLNAGRFWRERGDREKARRCFEAAGSAPGAHPEAARCAREELGKLAR